MKKGTTKPKKKPTKTLKIIDKPLDYTKYIKAEIKKRK